MKVDDELVEKLAHLARLTFKAGEKEKIKSDLQQMITFIGIPITKRQYFEFFIDNVQIYPF